MERVEADFSSHGLDLGGPYPFVLRGEGTLLQKEFKNIFDS